IGCSSSSEWLIPFGTLGHSALKAIVPIGAATGVGEIPGYAGQGIWYAGGVPELFWSWWFYLFGYQAHPELPHGLTLADRGRIASAFSAEPHLSIPDDLTNHLPTADILKAAG